MLNPATVPPDIHADEVSLVRPVRHQDPLERSPRDGDLHVQKFRAWCTCETCRGASG
jgi:hypothetical protein